jgi:hypothetical protein
MEMEHGVVRLLAKAMCYEERRMEERNRKRKGRNKGRKTKYLEIKNETNK